MKILSLFDWMSCWQIAINKLWITDYTYYASEIDKFAMQVAKENYPNTIHIWDVREITYWYWTLKWEFLEYEVDKIDLLIWWSPCQWFSIAGKQLNFEDPRSKLFFEYVRILKEVKPRFFLLENVKMKKEYQDIISNELYWIQPVEINSSLVSAQNRKRLYWVWELQENWTYKQIEIEQPEDKKIYIKDILEENVDKKYNLSEKAIQSIYKYRESYKVTWKSPCLTTELAHWWWKNATPWICREIECAEKWIIQLNNPTHSNNRLYSIEWNSPTLNTMQWWNRQHKILNRHHWNFKWSIHTEKSPCIRWQVQWNILSDEWYRIRKLTPTECERLQTVPDWYTKWISDTQRYKMLWNWWTVDVIAHILSQLKI